MEDEFKPWPVRQKYTIQIELKWELYCDKVSGGREKKGERKEEKEGEIKRQGQRFRGRKRKGRRE